MPHLGTPIDRDEESEVGILPDTPPDVASELSEEEIQSILEDLERDPLEEL